MTNSINNISESIVLSTNAREASRSPLISFPTPNEKINGKNTTIDTKYISSLTPISSETVSSDTPGLLPEEAYNATLPRWRAVVRTTLLQSLGWQSTVLAKMQDRVRTPWLDAYFTYTSSLGTHTFFMTFLPACFFFGYDQFGRGLLFVLALGVYVSSFVKDLFCVPRPFAPPVSRLTISTHHLEYGFPSTHSTNSISIALFIYTQVHRLAASQSPSPRFVTTLTPTGEWSISSTTYWISTLLLVWYTFSIVYGRLYTAMHSFSDCIMGIFLGVVIWAAHWLAEDAIESWLINAGWSVPLTIIPLAAIMVNQHPVPVEDCPCFEDAIAFVSVLMGNWLGHWYTVQNGFDRSFFATSMPGSGGSGWADKGMWWGIASVKMIFGILVIFTWRILAKSVLHLILPPTFRLLAQAFTLPNRRFYTPATDYKNVPSEFGLRPIPSVIDLPEHLEMQTEMDQSTKASGLGRLGGINETELRVRGGKVNGNGNGNKQPAGGRGYGIVYGVGNGNRDWELEKFGSGQNEDSAVKDATAVKHYDADVLTKVIVYCGIALLATTGLPILFEMLGWGVKSW